MQNKIFIGNLSFSTTEDKLFELVSPFGEVQDVAIPVSRDSGRSRGFAFVTFNNEEDAKKALELDGKEVDSRNIRVSLANSEAKTGGGSGGARRGSGGGGGKRPYKADGGGGRFSKKSSGGGNGSNGGGRRFGGGSDYGYDRNA